jgi:hypothetical protein
MLEGHLQPLGYSEFEDEALLRIARCKPFIESSSTFLRDDCRFQLNRGSKPGFRPRIKRPQLTTTKEPGFASSTAAAILPCDV